MEKEGFSYRALDSRDRGGLSSPVPCQKAKGLRRAFGTSSEKRCWLTTFTGCKAQRGLSDRQMNALGNHRLCSAGDGLISFGERLWPITSCPHAPRISCCSYMENRILAVQAVESLVHVPPDSCHL